MIEPQGRVPDGARPVVGARRADVAEGARDLGEGRGGVRREATAGARRAGVGEGEIGRRGGANGVERSREDLLSLRGAEAGRRTGDRRVVWAWGMRCRERVQCNICTRSK